MEKLKGVNKLMMSMMVKTAGKALAEKSDRTLEENEPLWKRIMNLYFSLTIKEKIKTLYRYEMILVMYP